MNRTAIGRGLHGAWLLARGEAAGALLLPDDAAGARRSFWAMAISLPGFLCLRLIDWTSQRPDHPGHALALDLLSYAVGWMGFAVASHHLARMLGRAPLWPRFIAAWNWCNVVQYLLLVAAALPGLAGAPAMVDQVAGLVALGWALWLEWFAAKLTLRLSGLAAAGLVVMDVAIGVMLAGVVGALGGG